MRAKYLRRRSKQGALLPEVATDYQEEVKKFLETDLRQSDGGAKQYELPWPIFDHNHVAESRNRGFFFLAPWLFPGGVGCFSDDRPFGGWLAFGKWIEHHAYYRGGRFSSDLALPSVALNMAYRR